MVITLWLGGTGDSEMNRFGRKIAERKKKFFKNWVFIFILLKWEN